MINFWNKTIVYGLHGSIFLFMLSVIIAIIVNPEYQFFSQFLSLLGTGPLGWIFNIPLMILGLATAAYYPFFYKTMKKLFTTSKLFVIGIGIGVITSLMIIFIGYFPVEGKTADIHNYLALGYFLLLMVQMPILSLAYRQILSRTPSITEKILVLKNLKWIGYIIGSLIILGLIGPSILAYTLQKIIIATTLYYLILSTKIIKID